MFQAPRFSRTKVRHGLVAIVFLSSIALKVMYSVDELSRYKPTSVPMCGSYSQDFSASIIQ